MTITTSETVTANGVTLNTLAYNIRTLSGRLATPARVGGNIPVPGRHGAIRTPRKRFGQGQVVLSMWVLGADTDGHAPASGPARARLLENVDMLVRVFAAELVELVWTLPDGTARRLSGEVTDVIDFTTAAGGSRAEFAVTLSVPGAFWTDTAPVSAAFTGPGSWDVTEFAGATAPMDDLVVTLTGGSNPRVECAGVWVEYGHVFAPGESVTLDCGSWGLAGGGGLVPDLTRVRHGGDLRWFVLTSPAGDPTPVVTVSHTGGAGAVGVELSGYRKYLTG